MRFDVKVKRLIAKYGIAGYGLYNYILECIAFDLDPESPVPEIEESAKDLAEELGMDTLLVEEIVKFCVDQKLFIINPDTKRIMCLKLLNHLDNTMSSNPQIKGILQNFKKLEETSSALKQIRSDKIRVDKNQERAEGVSSILETVISDDLREALRMWIESRGDSKAPVTEQALKIGITTLESLYPSDYSSQVECVNQTILNGWKGFFAIKGKITPLKKKSIYPDYDAPRVS